MVIYKITNKIDGKIYIGQTVQTVEKRWKRHKTGDYGRNTDTYLYRAIQHHGVNNFTIEQIDEAKTLAELNVKEQTYIKAFDSLAPKGYNLLPGGDNRQAHPETRIKISETIKKLQKGKPIEELFGGKKWNGGNTHSPSEETRDKIRQKLKGKPIEHRWTGGNTKPRSEEAKAHLSKLNKGKPNKALYKPIYAVETGEHFESINAAADRFNTNRVTISGLLKSGKQGRLGLSFKFVEEAV